MITISSKRKSFPPHILIKSLVSDRLKDKRRKLGITLYKVPNDTDISTKEIHFIESSSKTETILQKFHLVKNIN